MRSLLAILVAAMLTATAWADGNVSRLKLRPQATVYATTVTLADVLVLTDAEPELVQSLGDKPLGLELNPQRKLTITHNQVVRRIESLGINLSRILVSGATACEVTLHKPVQNDVVLCSDESSDQSGPLVRGTSTQPAGARTLADVLRTYVESELKDLGGIAELQFDRGGQEYLQLTTPPWDFSVTSSGSDKLGLREFRVVIRQDAHVQRTAQVFAQVRLSRPVVIARRPLSIGNFIRPEDVGLETRVFSGGSKLGLAKTEAAIGQQVKQFVPAGEAVLPEALKAVDLVQRSRPVTIVGANPNVQVRLSGVALDSGGYGDTVRVRIGDQRAARQELRGTVTGIGTVRLVEGNS